MSQHPTNFISTTNKPAFLMNVPFSLSAEVPNNLYMQKLSPDKRIIDQENAISQFMSLYSFVSRFALVYLLPSCSGLQDQTYVANLGIVLPHTKEQTVVIANYYSEPRRNESSIGLEFFKHLGFSSVQQAPAYFEGEADLKHIKDNIYIGAHGLRTSKNALDWFNQTFEMKVIPFFMKDGYLYHLDCCVFPILSEQVAVCTHIAEKKTLQELEKYTYIYDIEYNSAYAGLCNSVVLGKYILCESNIEELSCSDKNYELEKTKIESLNKLCAYMGMEPVLFNLSEFHKSGASLSCMMMHLNRNNYGEVLDYQEATSSAKEINRTYAFTKK